MKVAVCLSGQLRSFKRSYESLYNNIIEPTEADVYVYAWNFETKENNEVTKRFSEDGSIEELLNLYSPKECILEDCERFLSDKNFDFPTKAPETIADRMMCMFYTNLKCYEQAGQNDYDIIFRCRTEIEYERPISTDDLNMAQERLIIPKGLDGRDGYQDSFAFGTSENMKTYSSVYDKIPEYSDDNIMIHPEFILKHHLKQNKVPIERIEFPMLLRGKRYA